MANDKTDEDMEWDDYGEFDFYSLHCEKQIDEPNFCSKECEFIYECWDYITQIKKSCFKQGLYVGIVIGMVITSITALVVNINPYL